MTTSGGMEEGNESLQTIKWLTNENRGSKNPLTMIFLAEGMMKGAKSTKMAPEMRK